MEQRGVRILLLSLAGGVFYLFGSLVVLVTLVRSACGLRPVLLSYALLGVALLALCLRQVAKAGLIFCMPAVFFLVGTGIPAWLFAHATAVCAAPVGR